MSGPKIGSHHCDVGIQRNDFDGNSLDELLDARDCLVTPTGRTNEDFRER